jgi:uncharacterized protein YggE
MEIPQENKKKIYKVAAALGIILCFYFAVKFLSEFRAYNMMGSSGANTITLTGEGEVSAVPDIASVYFTIRKEAKTVKEAQEAVAEVEKKALESIRAKGIEDKDIKVTSASFNPKYEYRYDYKMMYPCSGYNCPPGKNIITGYEAYESITLKIRNTDSVGEVMQGLGTLGVEELNGPNFMIDDEDGLKAEARQKAIADAKAKAKVLAKDLGVRLGRVTNFSEGGDYGYPMMYAKAEMMDMDGASSANAPAELPKGENTIYSNVTITYEIR